MKKNAILQILLLSNLTNNISSSKHRSCTSCSVLHESSLFCLISMDVVSSSSRLLCSGTPTLCIHRLHSYGALYSQCMWNKALPSPPSLQRTYLLNRTKGDDDWLTFVYSNKSALSFIPIPSYNSYTYLLYCWFNFVTGTRTVQFNAQTSNFVCFFPARTFRGVEFVFTAGRQ